ncbi:class I SAM-dependent methyltransferase [Streptomyces sp. CA-249302]|uniref:class I SAM-dependent methyltransferase n=1 Tax=Streptomyces sp. CA-249302 TaxID=3240058 RepID=UPI003D9037D5
MDDGYIFDQSWKDEHARLRALEDVYDGQSRHRLAELGVAEGWQCLEVGCGAGSIARWLAQRVGTGGRVLAIASTHGSPSTTACPT